MFKIYKKSSNELVIYKSIMVDAARRIIKKADQAITSEAETAISNMLIEMDDWFGDGKTAGRGTGKIAKLQFQKKPDSDYVELTSMNSFKIWLIKMQQSEELRLILSKLRDYCRKKGDPLPELNITFGDMIKERIYNTDVYFRNSYRADWLKPETIKKAVRDVDKSEVIEQTDALGMPKAIGNAAITINSPVFGIMPVEKLSGGVKTLILIYNNPEMVFNASTCGDNCVKWIEKFSRELDFVICLYHTMQFTQKKFKAYIVNADVVVDNYEDYIKYSDEYCRISE